MGRGKHWKEAENAFLRRHLGRKSVAWIAEQLGRSVNAVRCRAVDLGIKASKNYFSLLQIINETGYNYKQLVKAKKELNQDWKRVETEKGRFKITLEQKEELLIHLAKPGPKYSSKPGPKISSLWETKLGISCCLHCSTSIKSHKALGLCNSCFRSLQQNKFKHQRHRILIKYWHYTKQRSLPTNALHPLKHFDYLGNSETFLLFDILRVRWQSS